MVVKKEMNGFELCAKHQIPVQVSMGGGYSPDIKTIIEAHATRIELQKYFLNYFNTWILALKFTNSSCFAIKKTNS
jgi:acetoin utilization deacetylase AcuC-like enzyme